MDIPKSKGPVSYFVMSDEQIAEICRLAGDAGGKAALQKYKETVRQDRQRQLDKRYHNTELLLENYVKLKQSVENAVFDIHQVEEEQSVKEILDLMSGRDDAELMIQSVKESKTKTAIIVKHIDAMLTVYQAMCNSSMDQLEQRRCSILMDRYINTPVLPVRLIAEKNYISEDSVYLDLKQAKKAISTLIFGIDGALMDT